MIVCLCNRVSDRDIKAAVQAGTACFEQLQDDTGLASACGCCHDCAREVFADALRATGRTVPAARVVHISVSA